MMQPPTSRAPASQVVQGIIADLIWEVQRVNGRWATAMHDWQRLDHRFMRYRIQHELCVLRYRLLEILSIAEALQPTGDGLKLALLKATCRLTLAVQPPFSWAPAA